MGGPLRAPTSTHGLVRKLTWPLPPALFDHESTMPFVLRPCMFASSCASCVRGMCSAVSKHRTHSAGGCMSGAVKSARSTKPPVSAPTFGAPSNARTVAPARRRGERRSVSA